MKLVQIFVLNSDTKFTFIYFFVNEKEIFPLQKMLEVTTVDLDGVLYSI